MVEVLFMGKIRVGGTWQNQREDGKQLYSIFSFFLIFKFKPKANKALKRKNGHAEEKRGLEVAESPPSPKALSTDRPIPLSFVKNLRPNVEGAQRVEKDRGPLSQ